MLAQVAGVRPAGGETAPVQEEAHAGAHDGGDDDDDDDGDGDDDDDGGGEASPVQEEAHARAHDGGQLELLCKLFHIFTFTPSFSHIKFYTFTFKLSFSQFCNFFREIPIQVARQAACYQAAMEQLVRLDIPKALPILAQYLTVMSDLIVHPDAR